MRRLLPAALAAAVFVSGTSALATTLGDLYPAFPTRVQERLSGLVGTLTKDQKKQKAALTKASKALTIKTDDVGKTIADAVKAIAPLEPVFGTDAQFTGVFDSIVGDMHATVSQRADALNTGIAILVDPKKKAAAQSWLTKAQTADAGFSTATTHVARLQFLGKEYAAVVKAEAILLNPGAGLVALTRLDATIGTTHVQTSGLIPAVILRATYDQSGTGNFTLSIGGGRVESQVVFSLAVADPGTGVHAVALGANSWYAATRDATRVAADGGSITFTVWDPNNRSASGTLTASFADGTKLKGTFSTIDVGVQ